MNVQALEPFGLCTLAFGLTYSLGVLIVDQHSFRFHFIVLVVIVFVALLSITMQKYLVHKYTCEKMNQLVEVMRRKRV